jgi:hypothetical protein
MARIVEIDSWTLRDSPDFDFDTFRENGAIGVVVKATQGALWTYDRLPEMIRRAKAADLLCGVLHYASPGLNPAEIEAEHLLESLPDDDLPLGLWCELDDIGGIQPFELGAWVETWTKGAVLPKAEPVILVDPERTDDLVGFPWGRRWVSTGPNTGSVGHWAVRNDALVVYDNSGETVSVTDYDLRTTRSLNAPSSGASAPVRSVVPAEDSSSDNDGLRLPGDPADDDDDPIGVLTD